MMRTAAFQRDLGDGRIRCDLCPHHCALRQGGSDGLCMARGVRDGELKALCYGMISSAGLDPMEKKPLYHFRPGSDVFSIGGWGCNFSCKFCQNWTISQQVDAQTEVRSPGWVIQQAKACGSNAIAYTYNEPLVGFEFVLDCAGLARQAGVANVLVTNGYVERGPARDLLPFIDALNIDIKSMNDGFYRKLCGGRLEPVLQFSRQAVEAGCHVEITNLVVPGLNDTDDGFRALAGWIKDNLGQTTPLHLSAYRPEYKLEVPPTSSPVLEHACRICSEQLFYVYVGNLRTKGGQDTRCPQCGAVLISRTGYSIEAVGIRNGSCSECGRKAEIRP